MPCKGKRSVLEHGDPARRQSESSSVPFIQQAVPPPGQRSFLPAAGVQTKSSTLVFQQGSAGSVCLGWRLWADLLQAVLEVPRESRPWQGMRGGRAAGWIAASKGRHCGRAACSREQDE